MEEEEPLLPKRRPPPLVMHTLQNHRALHAVSSRTSVNTERSSIMNFDLDERENTKKHPVGEVFCIRGKPVA